MVKGILVAAEHSWRYFHDHDNDPYECGCTTKKKVVI